MPPSATAPGPVFETERLTIRPYGPDDAGLVHQLIGDLRVFFWREAPGTREEAETLLAKSLGLWNEKRIGWFPVFEKASGDFAGQVILQVLQETGEFEIGYHFRPEMQGKGYATEAAAAVLDHGFRDAKLPRIVAVVLPDNAPSQAVMKKLGLPYEKDIMKAGLLHNYFALNREAYPHL